MILGSAGRTVHRLLLCHRARRRARGQHPPVRWAWACRVQFPQVAALLPHDGAMLARGSAAAVRWRLAVGGV